MSDDLLHTGCLRQALRDPSEVAVVCNGKELAFGELVRRAQTVAAHLDASGVEKQSIVGVLVDRSLEAAVGVLGVLLSGRVYLPLDADQPEERLRVILAEAGATTVLRGPGLEQRILVESVSHLSIPAIASHGSELPESLPANGQVTPDDLAYVIFTSGSTGKPKGVMIEHRGAVNTISDINERFHVGPGDRVLMLSAFGFDLSVYDLFGIWAAGGTVIIPTPSEGRDPAAYLRLIREHRITIWNSVPALLELLVGYAEDASPSELIDLSSLRLVLLSGDWIPVTLPDRFRRLQPNSEVISLGGATEASIWSVIYPIQKVEPSWKSIPYGRALRGQAIHVLNEQLRESPPGGVGEIYIGGIGVARGYIRRSDLTAAQFLRDPFSSDTSARLYKTGDLGRVLPDGNVEFLGRADFQVKINGQRIELGEVEAAFLRHSNIREATVIAVNRSAGRKQLVAFFVAQRGDTKLDDVRGFLAQHLPAYMIPTRMHNVESLPLTPTGKIDRQRLIDLDTASQFATPAAPAPDGSRIGPDFTDADSTWEASLVEIWRTAFERRPIRSMDDFFAMGGDSLVAIALAARVERRFGQHVDMVDFIRFPTIRQFAAHLRDKATVHPDCGVVMNRGKGGPIVFFVPPITGDLFEMRELALRLPCEWTVVGLQPRGVADGEQPERTIEAIAADYLKQVRHYQPRGPHRLVGFSFGGTVAFEMAHVLVRDGETPPVLVMIDAPRHGRNTHVRAVLRFLRFIARQRFGWTAASRSPHGRAGWTARQSRLHEAHYEALCCYQPSTYSATVNWLRALQRPGLIKGLVDDFIGTWDWRTLVPHSPQPDWVSGNHDTLFRAPNVDELACRVRAILRCHR
jgi:amino acid adenylation domain-containing protein